MTIRQIAIALLALAGIALANGASPARAQGAETQSVGLRFMQKALAVSRGDRYAVVDIDVSLAYRKNAPRTHIVI